MAETTTPPRFRFPKVDGGWLASLVTLALLLVFDTGQVIPSITSAGQSLLHTAPFIIFAVFAVAYIKATGAETLIAQAFKGAEFRMIFLGALAGGLSPFCSCEVIPFIAGLLAVGAPLSAVMAFWLSSPLMDPAMFAITTDAISFDFALAKAVSAVAIGLLGGGFVYMLKATPLFTEPLRAAPVKQSCCSANPFSGKPVWAFWTDSTRVSSFRTTVVEQGLFLLKWLLLAYLIESLFVAYVDPALVAGYLGGDGAWPVFAGALIGGPLYLNGYAAVAFLGGLLEQGLAPGAAMSFVIAGGVTCIPAAVAVWPLVKPKVFAAYIGIGFVGAIIAGLSWAAIA